MYLTKTQANAEILDTYKPLHPHIPVFSFAPMSDFISKCSLEDSTEGITS